jgi:DNA helicase-2/ATP-dependent DNA helicase PcrA
MSYAALHSYLVCPLQYKYLHVCGFATREWPLGQLGTNLHRALAEIHLRAKAREKITDEIVREALEKNWVPFLRGRPETEQRFKESGLEWLLRYRQRHEERFERVFAVEESLQAPLEGEDLLLTGRVDLVCEADGGLEIIDFKARTREGLELLRPDLQLSLYGLACEQVFEQTVSRLTVHLLAASENELECYPWSDSQAQQVRGTVVGAVGDIREKRFPPNRGPHCKQCEFHGLCPGSTGLEDGESDTP